MVERNQLTMLLSRNGHHTRKHNPLSGVAFRRFRPVCGLFPSCRVYLDCVYSREMVSYSHPTWRVYVHLLRKEAQCSSLLSISKVNDKGGCNQTGALNMQEGTPPKSFRSHHVTWLVEETYVVQSFHRHC